jgi:hypothetical protein
METDRPQHGLSTRRGTVIATHEVVMSIRQLTHRSLEEVGRAGAAKRHGTALPGGVRGGAGRLEGGRATAHTGNPQSPTELVKTAGRRYPPQASK